MKFFHKTDQPAFLGDIARVFSRTVKTFGKSPAAVLWKNAEGQQLRFEVLAGILDDLPLSAPISINDFGCGYAALFDFLDELPGISELSYYGYDISKDMITTARQRTRDRRAHFFEASKIDKAADFTFVSGTYNLKLKVADKPWNAYVKESLAGLWSVSNKGLAFNMLDLNHPDQGEGLYYAEPDEFIDFCRGLSANVTLIDDYPLHEWTIFVRRDAPTIKHSQSV